MRRKSLVAAIAAIVATAITVSACTASHHPGPTGAASAPAAVTVHATATVTGRPAPTGVSIAAGAPIKLGVLTDSTGVGSSGFVTTEKGIAAYLAGPGNSVIDGHRISYVMADTGSSPTGALHAAQRLVETDKVFAVIEVTANMYGAEPYLLQQGIPVVGGGFDGSEWSEPANRNLFDAVGVTDYNAVSSASGQYMKIQGVTSCAAIGYGSSLSSSDAAKGQQKSCLAAGLKAGYLNANIPFGSTDMAPIALQIKQSGADGVGLFVVPSTAFALAAALRQLGVNLKVFQMATGYGGDLLSSSAAIAVSQGYQFDSIGLPIEAVTPATQKFAAALAAVGVTTPPTFAEQESYIAMAAFAAGLRLVRSQLSQESFMSALRSVANFDGEGLLYPGQVSFSDYGSIGVGAGPGGCVYVAQLAGTKFVPVQGTPLCGRNLVGVTTN
jgi:branched-chain amino acid transport system substrate-binding protein